jgi:hypothetical protein
VAAALGHFCKLVLGALFGGSLVGCNVLIGIDEHDAFPDNCGADALSTDRVTARFSFSDDTTGHCYSLVRDQREDEMGMLDPATFDKAKSLCAAAGGMLACINDRPELELIAKQVAPETWLGMNSEVASDGFVCLDGVPFQPDYPAWAPGEPVLVNGNCTVLIDGQIRVKSCGNRLEHLLCELAP